MSEEILTLLKQEAKKRNTLLELTLEKPDPLLIAREFQDEYIALVCALFSYGNASAIVTFLKSLDFTLLDESEEKIESVLHSKKYRFQSSKDIIEVFKTIKRFKQQSSVEAVFLEGYEKNHNVMEGLETLIGYIDLLNDYKSYGYSFFFGKRPSTCKTSPFKRWNMYLRWMVRKDYLDMGLWSKVRTQDLLIPLDTHTFNVAKKLGVLKRKSYDFKSVLELTKFLKELDKNDPIKYDFALYRIGQEDMLKKLKLIKH